MAKWMGRVELLMQADKYILERIATECVKDLVLRSMQMVLHIKANLKLNCTRTKEKTKMKDNQKKNQLTSPENLFPRR